MHQNPKAMPTFNYFAYGSCMCPQDLARSLGEPMENYIIGTASLVGYRLGFYYYSPLRCCGALDLVEVNHQHSGGSIQNVVHGVLYCLPQRFSEALDHREDVPNQGYRHHYISVNCRGYVWENVRTYVVANKQPQEIPPNDWYAGVVLRGAKNSGLPSEYLYQLQSHIRNLTESNPIRHHSGNHSPLHRKQNQFNRHSHLV
ncbi:MAG: gamma-glutamylcyclotransferase [Pseudanabaenaceae cyanobacterium]|jgi:cation transport regulator ChaC